MKNNLTNVQNLNSRKVCSNGHEIELYGERFKFGKKSLWHLIFKIYFVSNVAHD